jgi:hypothetical protein
VSGNLQNVNASVARGLPAYTIPYISCDGQDVFEVITDAFNATDIRNVLAAVLYSENHTHCNISKSLAAAEWLNLFTIIDKHEAGLIADLQLSADSLGMVQIFPDLSSLPPGTQLHNHPKGSPIRKYQFPLPCPAIAVLIIHSNDHSVLPH